VRGSESGREKVGTADEVNVLAAPLAVVAAEVDDADTPTRLGAVDPAAPPPSVDAARPSRAIVLTNVVGLGGGMAIELR